MESRLHNRFLAAGESVCWPIAALRPCVDGGCAWDERRGRRRGTISFRLVLLDWGKGRRRVGGWRRVCACLLASLLVLAVADGSRTVGRSVGGMEGWGGEGRSLTNWVGNHNDREGNGRKEESPSRPSSKLLTMHPSISPSSPLPFVFPARGGENGGAIIG